MRRVLLLTTIAGALAACSISPVISEPVLSGDSPSGGGSSRYHDCRLAAKDYCREVQNAQGDALQRCTAQATYDCLSGK